MNTSETPPQPRLRLSDARTQAGLSQQEVAERIGTTHVNVSRWERGITRPSPYFRRKLCTLFGKSEEELDLGANLEEAESRTTSTTPPAPAAQNIERAPASVAIYDPAIPLLPAIQLVGRENDLAQIKQQLCSGDNVALTALNGLPGVGKTALSIHIAHDPEIRTHFQDGVLWAGLGPTPNMPGLLSRWGTLLGISATQMATLNNNEAWAKAIRNAIGSRAMLLVIDDAWTLEEALTFRVGGPRCAHLVTTRFPNIASHMSIKGATMIRELGENESIALLQQLAPQVISHENQRVHDLVHAVGGLPLALTLMGNYLRKQAYSGPARRISAALERLSHAEVRLQQISEPHVLAESHPSLPSDTPLSMQSVIAVTDQLLGETARAALYALAIFPPKPSSFSEEAALAVAACTTDELDALSDAGMLESNGTDRYHLHQIIADYARLQIDEEALHASQVRLITYVTDYVETHKKDYELLELESGTILAALEIAQTQGMQAELVRMVSAFAPFLILRGFYGQAEKYLQRAHEAAVALGDEYNFAGILLYQGELALKLGDIGQAETHLQKGLEFARKVDDHERICDLLSDLGWIILKSGDLEKAEVYLQEGLTLAREIGNLERISGLLRHLGGIAIYRGDYKKAETDLNEGLIAARRIADREQMFSLLINLGVTATLQGNYKQAVELHQEGLSIARKIGHREGMSALLSNLGDLAVEEGDYLLAETYFQEGLTLAREVGNPERISVLLINLCIVTRKQKNYKDATTYLQEALNIARKITGPKIIANVLYEYGNLHLDQKLPDLAKTFFHEVLSITPKDNRDLVALAQYGLAQTLTLQGSLDEAKNLGLISFHTLEAIGDHRAKEVRLWLNSIEKNGKGY